MLNISDTFGTNRGDISWYDNSFLSGNGHDSSALTHEWDLEGMAIRGSDGREFRITEFRYYNWGETRSTTNTVKGDRDGAEVTSTAFEAYDPSYNPITVHLDATLDNVDEVRFYISAGGYTGDQSTTNHRNRGA